MKKIIVNFIILFFCLGTVYYCQQNFFFGKRNQLKTHFIGRNIYEERFDSFNGGVLLGNICTYYLTDSTTFRKYIGYCDEDEKYNSTVLGDEIKVVKYSWKEWYRLKKEIPIDSVIYSIKELKREGNFE